MRMTNIALALTLFLLAITGYLAWEGQQAAMGARKELEFVKRQQRTEEMARPTTGTVPLPTVPTPAPATEPVAAAPTTITPPPAPGTIAKPSPVGAPAATQAPVAPPPAVPDLPEMAGAGALPGGGLTVPKSVIAAEAAGIKTNTLSSTQKAVMAAKPLAKVKTVVKQQGFIVLDSGSKQNITKGMKLDIRRGNSVLGNVTVTDTIEENEAIANLDIASIPTGVEIEPGDELIEPLAR